MAERYLALVDAAAASGADACKLQTWAEMTVADFVIQSGPWAGRQLRELYEECRTPWEWHAPIFARCRERGLMGFSTPFDGASVDLLASLGCPIYKIASFEVTDLALVRRAAATGKPLIISTGMATEFEIGEAVEVARAECARDITLLKCVSAYPAPAEGFNLRTMVDMRRFHCDVGLSDHTRGTAVAVAATALGAAVIEKHITLDGAGPDGGFASTVDEFAAMVSEVRTAAAALGTVVYGPTADETSSLMFRRSIWVTRDVAAGERFTAQNLAVLRPALGAAPEHFDRVIGHVATRAAKRGEPFTLDLVQRNA